MSKTRYIHIGYPGCGSSMLQEDFFARHPQCLHIGRGLDTASGWASDELAICTEVEIRFRKELHYPGVRVHRTFASHFDAAEEVDDKATVGISFQHLACGLDNDVDLVVKARRIFDAFGFDTRVVLVVRNQLDLLRSLHAIAVRRGFAGTLHDYLDDLHRYQFRSVMTDLMFYDVYRLYVDLFGLDRVLVVPHEVIARHRSGALDWICSFLEIPSYTSTLEHRDAPSHGTALETMRPKHARACVSPARDDGPSRSYERLAPYWRLELGIEPPTSARRETGAEENSLKGAPARSEGTVAQHADELGADWSARLTRMFAESNRSLSAMIGQDLAALGYPS